ncbi:MULTISPECIES: biotin--[acetyl-CoA-carboxylase] ligase [unclassified Mycobacterium]|uniref:biotin--[acetyl-CoA-carboxylase] ligase n=1 Tax=unclassified Mycobacterium TaxID=2642494 RepID=UPI0029C7DE0D|nr:MULTISPECIES: biotin--[acetyl-CoA-carboxylase] ligase [unclassified Mycobacterium]
MAHSDSRQPLDVDALRAKLRPGQAWRQIDVVSSTGSTNADLLSRAQAGVDVAGSVLLAEFQSAGRGRHGRNWATPPRAQIAMSVGIDVTGIAAEKWGWLPLLTGVALVDSVAQVTGVSVGLKWPNDVLAGADKLAGVLAEVASPSPMIVIGFGLNVSLAPDELPTPTATSLQLLGATTLDRNVVVSAILDRLGELIERWRSAAGHDDQLRSDYLRCSLTIGTTVRAILPGDRDIVGVATGIDESGRLLIDDGTDVHVVAAGDITHLRPASGA